MARPEWRLEHSTYSIRDLSHNSSQSRRRSSASSESDFLEESIRHNATLTFRQNLTSQTAYAVEKMSQRTVPASMVAFSGKTCAYAFFFCPGVANILLYLWKLPKSIIKRVIETHTSNSLNDVKVSHWIKTKFPSYLYELSFKSSLEAYRLTRKKPNLPPELSKIPWFGPWTERWSGKESDLFYVFVKYYHIILVEYLPSEIDEAGVASLPGALLVQSQLLVNIDSTIHRQFSGSDSSIISRPYTSFEEVLSEPDASMSAISLLPSNTIRQVTENRLILLIREFLSDDEVKRLQSQEYFSSTFHTVLKAAANNVSVFDQSACFTLCDFLEEALFILSRFESTTILKFTVIDWPYWLLVCKRMVQSYNTTTETRLYSFLYAIWNLVAKDQVQKSCFCMEFLLEKDFFLSRFSHWCPMVRAYFMRLLCWRILRLGPNDEFEYHRYCLNIPINS